jgi:hypothetical protein
MSADILKTRELGSRPRRRHYFAMAIVATIAGGQNIAAAGTFDASVYKDGNFSGASCLLNVGVYPAPANFSCVPNDSVSSLIIGSGVRIELGENANFSGRQAYFDGGHAYGSLPRGTNDVTSAIAVFPRTGGAMATWYMSDYPHQSPVFWSEQVDGMAHSSTSWYITQSSSINKIPLTTALAAAPDPGGDVPYGTNPNRRGIAPSLANAGYNHMGDPDFAPRSTRCSDWTCYDVLIVPMQGTAAPAVAFYQPDMTLIGWGVVPGLGGPGPAGLVAYRGADDLIYLTDGGATSPLYGYSVDWQSLALFGTPNLSLAAQIPVVDRSFNSISYSNGQGGVFDSSGNLFYVCGGDQGASGNKIVVLAISNGYAVLQAHSENNWGPFTYPTDFEPEGLDFLDTTARSIPNFPSSQLHAVVLNNSFFGHDDATMYHYSF